MSLPVVTPVVRPTSLAGNTNGQLSIGEDLEILGALNRPTARAHPQAARSFRALRAVVRALFGEELTLTSAADAYRSYAIQESTFRLRYTTTRLPGRPTKYWQAQTWWQKPGTAMAATPGTSNHGFGIAFDLALGDGTRSITSNPALFEWLKVNAIRYGFSWETQSEPWHVRLVTGDRTPAAVLAYETPPAPAPDPNPGPAPVIPTGEHDMTCRLSLYGPEWYVYSDSLAYKRRVPAYWALRCIAAGVLERKDLPADILETLGSGFPFED